MSGDEVTGIKVIAHTRDGRVYESAQTVNDTYTTAAGVNSAIEDAGAELLAILHDRDLA